MDLLQSERLRPASPERTTERIPKRKKSHHNAFPLERNRVKEHTVGRKCIFYAYTKTTASVYSHAVPIMHDSFTKAVYFLTDHVVFSMFVCYSAAFCQLCFLTIKIGLDWTTISQQVTTKESCPNVELTVQSVSGTQDMSQNTT